MVSVVLIGTSLMLIPYLKAKKEINRFIKEIKQSNKEGRELLDNLIPIIED